MFKQIQADKNSREENLQVFKKQSRHFKPDIHILKRLNIQHLPQQKVLASCLVCLTLDQAVQVRALARDTVLCSWTRHFNLIVPLSTKMYYMGTDKFNAGGNPTMD